MAAYRFQWSHLISQVMSLHSHVTRGVISNLEFPSKLSTPTFHVFFTIFFIHSDLMVYYILNKSTECKDHQQRFALNTFFQLPCGALSLSRAFGCHRKRLGPCAYDAGVPPRNRHRRGWRGGILNAGPAKMTCAMMIFASFQTSRVFPLLCLPILAKPW